ncbi:hypothetical protein LFM09_40250 [Lentzea alba]|uniref:hypothetical protein n=1 Tax=Lentzea alba TaxID=2714351 RepID=UPI0039BEFA7B
MRMRKVTAAALTGLALVGLAGTATASASAAGDYPWPPKDITPVHKTKAELQKQADGFSAHQQRSYPKVFRGAQNVVPGPWGGEAPGVFDDMQYMANSVSFTYQGREFNVITQVNAPGFYTASPKQLCEREKCTGTVSDRRGGVIVFSELDQFNMSLATNFRPNGEVVWTQGSKQDDRAQLAAVASDRAYTFTK